MHEYSGFAAYLFVGPVTALDLDSKPSRLPRNISALSINLHYISGR